MILIADSGATKTDWRLIIDGQVSQFLSEGFNPRTHSLAGFVASWPTELLIHAPRVTHFYFYGAGLPSEEAEDLRMKMAERFPNATIEASTDVLGAARSLLSNRRGVVCILGTGSAVSLYDGQRIIQRVPSLGYLVGDEGSGVHLGKQFIKGYLRSIVPRSVCREFEQAHGALSEADFLSTVYSGDPPNTYLASFAAFVLERLSDPYCYQLVYQTFTDFFEAFQLSQFKGEPLAFCGSVAHFGSSVLRKVASERGFQITLIAQSPIAGLTLYHQRHG